LSQILSFTINVQWLDIDTGLEQVHCELVEKLVTVEAVSNPSADCIAKKP